jgi:5-methylcytosine-specific restriction protein A
MAIVRGDRIGESRALNEGSVEAITFFAALLWKAVSKNGWLPGTVEEIETKLYGRVRRGHRRTLRLLAELEGLGVLVRDPGRDRLRVPNLRFWVRHGRPDIPAVIRLRVLERDSRCCRRCSSVEDLQLDHVVAYAKGGTDDESNLQTLCWRCNRAKGAS